MILKILDKLYFDRSLKRDIIGLGQEDVEWLKDHSNRLKRICETMKQYIGNKTFNSLTVREHQRRKDWFDCLTAVQKLSDDSTDTQKINWISGKKVEKKEEKTEETP